jgi:hypothetical protein
MQCVKPSDRCVNGLQIVYILLRLRYRQTFDIRIDGWSEEATHTRIMVVNAMGKK